MQGVSGSSPPVSTKKYCRKGYFLQYFLSNPKDWYIIDARSAAYIISSKGAGYHHARACIFPYVDAIIEVNFFCKNAPIRILYPFHRLLSKVKRIVFFEAILFRIYLFFLIHKILNNVHYHKINQQTVDNIHLADSGCAYVGGWINHLADKEQR